MTSSPRPLVCRSSLALALVMITYSLHAQQPQQTQEGKGTAPALTVCVDPRVELLAIVFHYAGNPEYNMGRVDKYTKAVDNHFGAFRRHPVITKAANLRRQYGVSYDAVMSMAVHLNDVDSLTPRVDTNAGWCQLDERWKPQEVTGFLELLCDFAKQSDFNAFIESQQPFYVQTENRMRDLLEHQADLAWFEQFHGTAPTAPFTVCLGLMNGGGNYGPKVVHEDGTEELFAVMGVWKTDFEGDPIFPPVVIPTLVHEFNHSFINHLVYAHSEDLRPAGEAIFAHVEEQMQRQAYGNWQTMMHESLVRAATARYVRVHNGDEAGKREIQAQIDRGFIWMEQLAGLMDDYETDREKWPTFADYMPRVIEYYSELGPRFEEVKRNIDEKQAALRPKVVSIRPANGADNVDPATDRIVITFDRPMGDGYMVNHHGENGKDHYPHVSYVEWNDEQTVFTMHVKLEPNWTYRFALNSPSGGSFRSQADNMPLARVEVEFSTLAHSDN